MPIIPKSVSDHYNKDWPLPKKVVFVTMFPVVLTLLTVNLVLVRLVTFTHDVVSRVK